MKLFQTRLTGASRLAIAAACVAAAIGQSSPALAATLAHWNFNVPLVPGNVTNSPAPAIGSGSATPVGMNGGNNNADILAATGNPPSSDSGTPNNAWRIRGGTSNGWSGTVPLLSGARFNTSTAGKSNIQVSLEVHATDGSARHGQFQYTVDGTNFTSLGGLIDFNLSFDGFKAFSYDLSSIPAANNNPLFGFKLVSQFSPNAFTNAAGPQAPNTAFQRASATNQTYTGGAGNWRFDLVTITGVPEPSSMALVAVSSLGLALARSRRGSS